MGRGDALQEEEVQGDVEDTQTLREGIILVALLVVCAVHIHANGQQGRRCYHYADRPATLGGPHVECQPVPEGVVARVLYLIVLGVACHALLHKKEDQNYGWFIPGCHLPLCHHLLSQVTPCQPLEDLMARCHVVLHWRSS